MPGAAPEINQGKPKPPPQEVRIPVESETGPRPPGFSTGQIAAIRAGHDRGRVDQQVHGFAFDVGASFTELERAMRAGDTRNVEAARARIAARLVQLAEQAEKLGASTAELIEVARDSGVTVPAIRGIGERASGGPQRGEFSTVGANPSGSQRLRPLKSFAGWEEHFISGQPPALRRAFFEQSASAAPVAERAAEEPAEEPLRSAAAPQKWEEKFMAGAPAALQWEFEEVRKGRPGAPVTAEISAEAVAETRRFAAMNIQNQLIREFIQDRTGGRAPQADSGEADTLAAQWIERYAADFRERVAQDLEVVNAIDEGRINDAARLSSALLYEKKVEVPAGGLTGGKIYDSMEDMQEQRSATSGFQGEQRMGPEDIEVILTEEDLRAVQRRIGNNIGQIRAGRAGGMLESVKSDFWIALEAAQSDLDKMKDALKMNPEFRSEEWNQFIKHTEGEITHFRGERRLKFPKEKLPEAPASIAH